MCAIDGCDKLVRYLKDGGICQMHYFRMMRNGHYGLNPIKKKIFIQNPAGYVKLRIKDHPLSNSDGYVYEHRLVVFDKYGYDLPVCEICGSAVNWDSCHIDHIDGNVTNNSIDNLRPVCCGCNTSRTERRTSKKFDLDGEAKTINQLLRIPGIEIRSRGAFINRICHGMSVKEALYSKNKTRPSKFVLSNKGGC